MQETRVEWGAGVVPAPPHQTVRAVFPHTAFRCSSPRGMRLLPACCRRHFIPAFPAQNENNILSLLGTVHKSETRSGIDWNSARKCPREPHHSSNQHGAFKNAPLPGTIDKPLKSVSYSCRDTVRNHRLSVGWVQFIPLPRIVTLQNTIIALCP